MNDCGDEMYCEKRARELPRWMSEFKAPERAKEISNEWVLSAPEHAE